MKINLKSELSIKILKFFLPFLVAAIGIFIFYLVTEKGSFGKLFLLMVLYFVPPLGKETIIPIGVFGRPLHIPFTDKIASIPPIDPLIMAIAIAFVDIVVALFLVWNYDLAKKIPLIGDFMGKVEKIGKSSSEKYSWIKPLRFFGIILFVMVPFQGSGGLVGSILGRLIGMKPRNTFLAITIGTIIGCTLIAYFSNLILDVFVTNFLQFLLVLVVILIIAVMIYAYRNANNKKNNKKDSNHTQH